jgi:uncharacterized membrane protein YedE/YeeE
MNGLLVAGAIGVGFGWVLERGGMGSARKLVGQFLLTDLTVFRVLFTAVVTAMLGIFWLRRLGWVASDAVFIPETWLLPQLVGGAVFGVGFALCGLCPGTSCVAASSGRVDGLAVVGGMLLGVVTALLAWPAFADFHRSTARGVLTLPDLLGVSDGVVVFGVTVVALGAFALAGRIEGRAGDPPEGTSEP